MGKQALIDSYLEQTLTTPGGGRPPDAAGYVFGTATAGMEDWITLHTIQQELIDRLIPYGIYAEPGYAIGFLRTFVEPVVYATGMDHLPALGFARSAGLEYYVHRTPDRVRVLSRKGRCQGEAEPRYADDAKVCVMPNRNPKEVCILQSRPYLRTLVNAGLEWRRDRFRLTAALGCDTCQGGYLHLAEDPGRVGQLIRAGEPSVLLAHKTITRYTARLEPHYV